MKLLISLLVGFMVLLPIANAQAGEVLDRVNKTKKLVMSTDPEYPPQSFLNKDNQMDGFDIDVGKEIAKRMGVKLETVTPGWDIIVAGGWQNRWDISVGSMTPTEERAEKLDFPVIYYYTQVALAVPKDSKASKPEDLNGKIIGACGGCTHEQYLQHNLKLSKVVAAPKYRINPKEIRGYETVLQGFDDLKIGRLDAVVSEKPTIEEAIKNGYPFKLIPDILFYEPLAVAVDKGDPAFTKKIADIVHSMHHDGTLAKLSKKWYDGADLTKNK